MTTTETFDQLFSACWEGEAPWETLADFILEHRELLPLKASHLYLNQDRYPPGWVTLSVVDFPTLTHLIGVYIEESLSGREMGWPWNPQEVSNRLPSWMAEQKILVDNLTKTEEIT